MKITVQSRVAISALALSAFCAVHAQDTFALNNIPSPPRTATAATFANSTPLGPANSTYVLGSAMTINSGSITVLNSASAGSFHRLELYNSAFPTLTYLTGQLFQTLIGTAAGLTNTTSRWPLVADLWSVRQLQLVALGHTILLLPLWELEHLMPR